MTVDITNFKPEAQSLVQAVVKLIFKMYAGKGMSKDDLCRDINNKIYLLYDIISSAYMGCDSFVNGSKFDEREKENLMHLFMKMVKEDPNCDCQPSD